MNLTRLFSANCALAVEAALAQREADAGILEGRYLAELQRANDEIESLRAQNLALVDRICLLNHAVPVSEPLLRSAAQQPDGTRVEPSDRNILRSGPVARARQLAEDERTKTLTELEAERARAATRIPVAAAGGVAAAAVRELEAQTNED